MTMYILYRIGYLLVMGLPLRLSYGIACLIADIYYFIAWRDRAALVANIKIILNDDVNDESAKHIARDVFRNFGKYLVDFFRFSKIDQEYIKKFVKVEGLKNIDAARSRGKGVIILSAHMGNWELGGLVLSSIGYPMSAVVLTHQNKRINDFFTRQRKVGKMRPIEIGITLKSCYTILKSNNLLGLMGDRDFTKNGLVIEFFGKKTLIPKGPGALSYRIGSAIVPSFMVREADDTFRLVFEEPIFPIHDQDEDAAIRDLTGRYLKVIESYISRYPTQWYVFKKLRDNHEKLLRPDTII